MRLLAKTIRKLTSNRLGIPANWLEKLGILNECTLSLIEKNDKSLVITITYED